MSERERERERDRKHESESSSVHNMYNAYINCFSLPCANALLLKGLNKRKQFEQITNNN